jgi:hypothetical protein
MNRIIIDWKFTPRKARKKSGHKRNLFKLPETWFQVTINCPDLSVRVNGNG